MKTIGLHRNGRSGGLATVPDDATLAVSALAGNEEALGALLTEHQQAAYNLAYRLLGSEPDAADAFQEGRRPTRPGVCCSRRARPASTSRLPLWAAACGADMPGASALPRLMFAESSSSKRCGVALTSSR